MVVCLSSLQKKGRRHVSLNPAISRSGGGSDLERLPIRRKWSFAQLAMKNPTFSSSDFLINNEKLLFDFKKVEKC